MPRFRVGCVPYVNAIPLVWWFHHLDEASPVEVVYAVPSQLPALHASREVDAILVSSIESLRTPGASVADGAAVASNGPVQSVRMFSRKPWNEIKTLALDQSSMTSNALAQIILREQFDVEPEVQPLPPDAEAMLAACDACVIIGDKGLEANPAGAEVIDLGSAWQTLTGLPFVWAIWTSHDPMEEALVQELQTAVQQSSPSGGNWKEVVAFAAARSGWNAELVHEYLTRCVSHQFGETETRGMALYAKKLMENGLVEQAHFPDIVRVTAEYPAPTP